MENKFEVISSFIDGLEESNVINAEEQALLLVGGAGAVEKTNGECSNGICAKDDKADNKCSNGICW